MQAYRKIKSEARSDKIMKQQNPLLIYILLNVLLNNKNSLARSRQSSSSLLPIDECEEWIWEILDCTKDCGFEYLPDDDKELLIFNTNDFFADIKALEKIKRITGMILVQLSSHNCQTQLWFCRPR
ncbi:MAG: hypothetical protein K0S67_1483 [Nitrososphaeraceae archaeon]|jgi:hypothetical protein|nr:hypothetical protein [Nitrososphaeraceae archaeon]MCD6037595.1 hypothetical protein [Nitrososphaeraceae archaeon]MDF2768744.1 hypothetical protein [Nitrososphaeraceae archaeon]